MIKNFNTEILGIDGKPMVEDGKTITMKTLAQNALQIPDQDANGEAKIKRIKTALKIEENPASTDLTAEEIVEIKKMIEKHPLPLVVMRVHEFLDASNDKPELIGATA